MSNVTGTLIKPDGTETEVSPAGPAWVLKEIQRHVGGYFEVVQMPNLSRVMLVDEDGIMKQLPPNPKATEFACRPIVGNVLIVRRRDIQ